MVTIVWGQGLSEDGRATFDSIEQARAMLEHDTDLNTEELDRLFEMVSQWMIVGSGLWWSEVLIPGR